MKYLKVLFKAALISLVIMGWIYLFTTITCSENPGEPEPVDPTDPCLECLPVEVPVVCSQLDATAEFTLIKDQSGPNDYKIVADGYPDELVSITDTASTPVDTSFTRVFENYIGGRISIERVSGSRAEAVGVAIIDLRCSE